MLVAVLVTDILNSTDSIVAPAGTTLATSNCTRALRIELLFVLPANSPWPEPLLVFPADDWNSVLSFDATNSTEFRTPGVKSTEGAAVGGIAVADGVDVAFTGGWVVAVEIEAVADVGTAVGGTAVGVGGVVDVVAGSTEAVAAGSTGREVAVGSVTTGVEVGSDAAGGS